MIFFCLFLGNYYQYFSVLFLVFSSSFFMKLWSWGIPAAFLYKIISNFFFYHKTCFRCVFDTLWYIFIYQCLKTFFSFFSLVFCLFSNCHCSRLVCAGVGIGATELFSLTDRCSCLRKMLISLFVTLSMRAHQSWKSNTIRKDL